jgi:hypothetical protein
MTPLLLRWDEEAKEWQWSIDFAGPRQRYGGYLAKLNHKKGTVAIKEAITRGWHVIILE